MWAEWLKKLRWKLKDPETFKDSCTPFGDLTYDGPDTPCYEQATLITSKHRDQQYETIGGEPVDVHWPVLDIDMQCHLVMSSTPGHCHLIIEKDMTWETYCTLLDDLRKAGIIEEGFARVSKMRKYSAVRRPGVYKEDG